MRQWLSIKDAATTLKISELTVRRRMKAGVLPARQEKMVKGYRWLVEVTVDDLSPDQTAPPAAPAADSGGLSGWADLVRELRNQNDRYKEDLCRRDRELETRAREVAELHVLLQQEKQHVSRLLRIHPDVPDQSQRGHADPVITQRHPFLKRLFGLVSW